MSAKPPVILEAEDPKSGRPAVFVFLHGYGDDAEGLPMGLAQQFQFNHKLPYLTWYLPNAAFNQEAMSTCWYMPKSLPSSMKPRIPGHEEDDGRNADDDDAGILHSCDTVDKIVREQLDKGIPRERIVVGGFSQGCAISLVWGLIGKERSNVAGIFPLSGYFPMADKIEQMRKDRGIEGKDTSDVKWFYVHGNRDALVAISLYTHGMQELERYVEKKNIFGRLYEGMAHSTCSAELRDMLGWFNQEVPP